jgi:hypothetical protein
MVRAVTPLLAILLALTGLVVAADNPPAAEKSKLESAPAAGNWKVSIPLIGGNKPLWIVKIEQKDGKWSGEVSKSEDVPPTTIEKLAVTGDSLSFNLKLASDGGAATFLFEVNLTKKDSDKLHGNVLLPNKSMQAVLLEKTATNKLDAFELNKETLAKSPDSPEAVKAGLDLLKDAKAKKAMKDDVKNWAEKTVQAAEKYGPRYERYAVNRIAELLSGEDAYADLGVEYAGKAVKLLTSKDKPTAHKKALEALATALETAGKKDEAKEVTEKIKKLDLSLKPEPFAGRTGKSDRTVLVELFTGAQCPPCVAADLAFDALGKAYKPSDVLLLEYHLHVPRPDPLANDETDERANYYGKTIISGTPTILFNGTPGAEGGGTREEAEDKYDEYAAAINPLLELPSELKVAATATMKDGKVDISAEVTAPAKPEERLRLRIALVEDKVDYAGTNGIAEHHNVVRAFVGGADGYAVKDKTFKTTASVDIEDLKKDLKKYLETYAKKKPFPTNDQPLELKNLKVVAFVQNQETHEVLQATQVAVTPAK